MKIDMILENEAETEFVTAKEFFNLPEYSMSVPTGNFVGKKWRRLKTFGLKPKSVEYHNGKEVRDPDEWLVGEYIDFPILENQHYGEPKLGVAIVWRKLKINSPWKEEFVESIMDS